MNGVTSTKKCDNIVRKHTINLKRKTHPTIDVNAPPRDNQNEDLEMV